VIGRHDDPTLAARVIVPEQSPTKLRVELLAVLDALVPDDALYANNYDGSGEWGEAA
jgi:hypothetical protein